MDVCDEKATGEDGSVSQHDDHGKEHPLDYHVASEICFQPFAPRHWRPVALLKCGGLIVWPA